MAGINRRRFFKGAALTALASAAAPTATRADDCARDAKAIDAAIWKSYFSVRRVWGYADRHSINPGDDFNIMLSTGPGVEKIEGRVAISRIGSYGDEDRKRVWTSDPITVQRQEVQVSTAALGADWTPAINSIQTDNWDSGYYTIDFLLAESDADSEVAYIIVNNPDRSGDVLVGLCTNTYNAYNAWGGYSLYESAFAGERAQILSFDRPAAPAFFDYDYYLVVWLDALADKYGFTVDYAANFDIHRDRAFTKKCKLFISGCHNEYWSLEEFDAVHARIFELGKNVVFFGANTAYWQIRYADAAKVGDDDWGRQIVCFKSADDPIRQRVNDADGDKLVTAMYRAGARRPETMLAGVAYQNYFDPGEDRGHRYPYKVTSVDSRFFEGVGWRAGDSIGDVVGYEWDNRDPEGDGRRLWDMKLSQIPAIEASAITVLFTGHPVGVDGKPGVAEAVTFTSPAGGEVFSTGSIRWAWGLGKEGYANDKFKAFNENVVLRLLGRGQNAKATP